MGGYSLNGTGHGGIPRPGGAATDGAAATAEVRHKMGVYLNEGSERGGVVWADVNLHSAKAEYGCAVYCNASNSVPVQSRGEEAGGTSGDAVAGKAGLDLAGSRETAAAAAEADKNGMEE